jgi:hypothetical protein
MACNQTNACFLGRDVIAADFSSASLAEWIPALTLKSDAGLWLKPFRGIPETNSRISLDLIYLNDEHRVIEVVESFPTCRIPGSSQRATSVLALPSQLISSSQTRKGDQLILSVAGEMELRLKQISRLRDRAGTFDRAALSSIQVAVSSPQDQSKSMFHPEYKLLKSDQMLLQTKSEPEVECNRSTRNWLQRWWSPDPRKSPRQTSPGLSATFWTGSSPEEPHLIRDISATGMFLVTGERWCPGTVIRMLITQFGEGTKVPDQSISVQSRAVRWGNEGVGLQFVVQDTQKLRKTNDGVWDATNRRDLDDFLRRIEIRSAHA